jgi:tetratricopeptide (TPR) repeat protein
MQWRRQRPMLAEQNQRKALTKLAKLVEEDPKHPDYRHTRVRVYHGLSVVLWQGDRRPEDAEARAKGLEILEALASEYPQVPAYRVPAIESRLGLAEALRKEKDLAGSEKLLRESLAKVTKLATALPRNRYLHMLLARHHRSLGLTLQRQGKKSEADEALRKAEEASKAGS